MSTEVLPVGITCQLACHYCYETPLRDANPDERYNREAVLASIEKLQNPWSLFGGEPLVLHISHVDELLSLAHKRWGHSGVQTNGALITDAHIALFKKYKTQIGISLDGPDELNDSRWAGTLDATRRQTAKTQWAIERLCEAAKTTPHLLPSIIVTLHAGNCAKEVFPRFVEWIRKLDQLGITSVNPHVMELDAGAHKLYLNQDELCDRLVDLWNLQETLTNLKFTKFAEVLKLLRGDDDVACTWHACDPLNTAAVQSIDHTGAPSVCARTFKGAQRWLPAEGTGYSAPLVGHQGSRHHTRQIALYVTPQEHGGCKDCEFWLLCMGQCPGEGEHGDWRSRSSYCQTWKRLFAEGEKRLRAVGEQPFSQWKDRTHIEGLMYGMWVQGTNGSLSTLVKQHRECTAKGMIPVKGGYHGDSGQ
jgi:uncharacterized protein